MVEEDDKLVRDRIPELIRADDEVPATETVAGEAYRERLHDQLDEEVAEYHESGRVAELADVLAVVNALAALDDVSPGELEAMRREKRAERGGFDDGVVLKRVE
ncbi:nucleoside triphosphate pyrophosphohydrolase [Salinirubrum litoreum]|uniref:Phosphoribosyl-ATP pyrophosphohydrolase n=1 Tax=Salinirubrum litoreum TaxID=1126234 RepID=A0ABD5R6Q6_9EURY|nr:nucleoside triphosphate pyrophosphohydrolase [Salinirubrum litoreum]